MKRILLPLIVVAMILMSCERTITYERINELETQMFGPGASPDESVAVKLADSYMLYAKQNPNDDAVPDMLFKALDVYVGMNISPKKAVEAADILIEKYPSFDMTPMAMYIKGFVYESMFKDLDKAEKAYRHFLETYPDNPMAEEVKMTILNLGIPLEKLVEQFED